MLDMHDPGGKVKIPLKSDVTGGATFSPCGRYRPLLWRSWGALPPGLHNRPFALWIGMNPSTADAQANDPTVAREVNYTREHLRLTGYAKCNLSDYRATAPKVLSKLPQNELLSMENLQIIRDQASRASVIVMAHGQGPRCLRPIAKAVMQILAGDDRQVFCLGLTAGGFPKHPLYTKADLPLQLYSLPDF